MPKCSAKGRGEWPAEERGGKWENKERCETRKKYSKEKNNESREVEKLELWMGYDMMS